jgi:hypothetical protein
MFKLPLAKQGRIKQSKANQSRAMQDKTEQGKARQSKATLQQLQNVYIKHELLQALYSTFCLK